MSSLLVRQIDDPLKHALRLRAAENGQSMEEEVRQILRAALGVPSPGERHVRDLEAVDAANRARATRGKAR
jgi:plasmid stability protein